MFANRDHEAVFAFYDPDIEWDGRAGPNAVGMDDVSAIYYGHEGVRTFWRQPWGCVMGLRE